MPDRVVGIGGIFFKARDPARLSAWYREHLGLAIMEWGGVQFEGGTSSAAGRRASLVWNIFPDDTRYFEPGDASFMINYRVEDLDALLESLRREGCDVDPRTESSGFGRFGWVADAEGNRVELWEPPMRPEGERA